MDILTLSLSFQAKERKLRAFRERERRHPLQPLAAHAIWIWKSRVSPFSFWILISLMRSAESVSVLTCRLTSSIVVANWLQTSSSASSSSAFRQSYSMTEHTRIQQTAGQKHITQETSQSVLGRNNKAMPFVPVFTHRSGLGVFQHTAKLKGSVLCLSSAYFSSCLIHGACFPFYAWHFPILLSRRLFLQVISAQYRLLKLRVPILSVFTCTYTWASLFIANVCLRYVYNYKYTYIMATVSLWTPLQDHCWPFYVESEDTLALLNDKGVSYEGFRRHHKHKIHISQIFLAQWNDLANLTSRSFLIPQWAGIKYPVKKV